MEWLDVLLGGGLTWAAMAYGQRRARKKAEAEVPKEPEPWCGCEHHYSQHDPETGACMARWDEQVLVSRGKPRTVKTGYYGDNHKVVYDHEEYETKSFSCTCKRYTGPEPLPRYVS